MILPRGDSNSHDDGKGYDFPALVAPGGLEQLIALSLSLFAQQVGTPAVRRDRLILTAHSGGGAALTGLLASRDPDEVQVFDALYGSPAALIAWMQQRLGGATAGTSSMRVIHGPTTVAFSRQVAQALAAVLPADDPRAARWRVESTGTAHGQIPGRYGWRLLADAGSDLPDTRPVQAGGTPSPHQGPDTGTGARRDARSGDRPRHPGRATVRTVAPGTDRRRTGRRRAAGRRRIPVARTADRAAARALRHVRLRHFRASVQPVPPADRPGRALQPPSAASRSTSPATGG